MIESNRWLEPLFSDQNGNKSSFMDKIAERFVLIYGAEKFFGFVGGQQCLDDWKQVWAHAFMTERLSPKGVKNALSAMIKHYETPPTLSEFIDLASPIPVRESFLEAQRNISLMSFGGQQKIEWSNPAIYWAAKSFGFYALRQTSFEKDGRKWRHALRTQLRDAANMKPVPIKHVEDKKPADKSVAKAVLANALEMLKRRRFEPI